MTVSTSHQHEQEETSEKATTTAPSSSSSLSPSSSKMMMSQCPYALALSEDEEASTTTTHHSGSAVGDIAAELSQCPAFHQESSADVSCPFKQAKSTEQIQKTLAQIPPSHHQEHGAFFHVLKHLHQEMLHNHPDFVQQKVLPNNTGDNNGIMKCPMQPYLDADHKFNFAQSLEDCSLAAIMGRLAADMERQEHQHSDDDDESLLSGGSLDGGGSSSSPKVKQKQDVSVEELNPVENETSPQTITAENNHQQKQRDSLAQALKTGTAASHQAAEDVHFVRNFIRGQIDRELYQALILSLYHVYVALEDALDEHAPHHFDSCHFPDALRRVPSLREDVEFWHNTTDPSPRTISPATQDYIHRIEYLAQNEPLLLLAHSYTRYLGDLSGGRVLARVARRALDLDKDTGEGLAFYRFEQVASYKQFKDEYRTALDELPLTPHQIAALVAEANVAFCLNMRLFQELDVTATIPGARVMSLEEVMKYAHPAEEEAKSKQENNNKEEEDKCPFLVNKKQQQQQESLATAASPPEQHQHAEGKRCPWPFIFAHDPVQGLKDWQTWAFVFMVVAIWYQF